MMSDGVFGVGSREQNVPEQRSTKLTQKAEKGQSWGKRLISIVSWMSRKKFLHFSLNFLTANIYDGRFFLNWILIIKIISFVHF